MSVIRGFLALVSLLLLLGLLGSFGGALHPVGDSLAVFRREIAIATVMAGALWALAGGGGAAAVPGLAGIAALAPLLWAAVPQSRPAGPYAHYQKNAFFEAHDPEGIAADIRAVAPQTITLQEMGPPNQVIMDLLDEGTWPARLVCGFPDSTVAILSSWPLVEEDAVICNDETNDGLAAIRVQSPIGPLWVVSVHLSWPWPKSQASMADGLLPRIAQLEGPVIVAGDFNQVAWSHLLHRFEQASRSRRAGRILQTFDHRTDWPLRLNLDHVLLPGGGPTTLDRRPLLGSDHYGIVARWGAE